MLDAVAWAEAEAWSASLIERDRGAVRRDRARSTTSAACRRWSTSTASTEMLGGAVERVLGPAGLVADQAEPGRRGLRLVPRRVPGAMGRLGTRTPGGPTYDLHQGNLRIDERATAIGARVLAEAAVLLERPLVTDR